MKNSPHIFDVSAENFASAVLEQSHHTPILLDTWANWCSPCKMLMPILESLAESYGGKFTLAKLNSEANQALVTELGIRSLPTVRLYIDGEVADEFSGALPEAKVKEFLSLYIQNDVDELFEKAKLSFVNGELQTSKSLLEQIIETDSDHLGARIQLSVLALNAGELTTAEQHLSAISSEHHHNSDYIQVRAKLTLALEVGSADIENLAKQHEDDPNNLEAKFKLSQAYIAAEQYKIGLDHLLDIVRTNREFKDDGARSEILSTFNLLGSNNPLVSTYRKKLANLLN